MKERVCVCVCLCVKETVCVSVCVCPFNTQVYITFHTISLLHYLPISFSNIVYTFPHSSHSLSLFFTHKQIFPFYLSLIICMSHALFLSLSLSLSLSLWSQDLLLLKCQAFYLDSAMLNKPRGYNFVFECVQKIKRM
jgi:hypothetical protein